MNGPLPGHIQFLKANCDQFIETHISYILIFNNSYVYKFKKPIKLEFLDYTTLIKRKRYCIQELQLNKRLAPELYVEVVSILQINDTYEFGSLETNSEYPIIDYAVKMNKFDETNILSKQASISFGNKTSLMNFGKDLAKFHSNPSSGEFDSHIDKNQYGSLAHIKRMADNNFIIVKKFIGSTITNEFYERLTQAFEHFFNQPENIKLLESRALKDKIKPCHGDLHLGNIAAYNDKLIAFDCIEFNDEFRYIDVIYDLAFLYMDLHHRKAFSEANTLLNTYFAHTKDYEGILLLPFYASMRAIIRGFVNALQLEVDNNNKEEIKQTAENYFELAYKFIQPKKGKIIATHGFSGSGKSSLAKLLAPQVNGVILRSDLIRKEIITNTNNENNYYTEENIGIVYDYIINSAISMAKRGINTIIDASFLNLQYRQQLKSACEFNEIQEVFIHLDTPDDDIINRISKRKDDISDATIDVYTAQKTNYQEINENEGRVIHLNVIQQARPDFIVAELNKIWTN